jgi:hypothetical protein
MTTITLSKPELLELKDALELAVDVADDTATEALYTKDNVVSFDTLETMRNETDRRIDKLVCLVRLHERVKLLK